MNLIPAYRLIKDKLANKGESTKQTKNKPCGFHYPSLKEETLMRSALA
jgi:hypothetical protein